MSIKRQSLKAVAISTLYFAVQLKEEFKQKAKSSSENEHEDEDEDGQVWGRKSNISLLDQHTELKKMAEGNLHNLQAS